MSVGLLGLARRHQRSRRIKRSHKFVSPWKRTVLVQLDIPALEADSEAPMPLAAQLQRHPVALYLYGWGMLLGCFESVTRYPDGRATIQWEISEEDRNNIDIRLGGQPLVVTMDAFIHNPSSSTDREWQCKRAYITTQAAIDVEKAFANEQYPHARK